jgi:hypothetical protein
MRYYINGKKVNSQQAKDCIQRAYLMQGGDPLEFDAVWEGRDCEFAGEEMRDQLNAWSGYVVEIFTDEEDEALDD